MKHIDTRYEEHAIGGQEIIVDAIAHTGAFSGLIVVATTLVSEVIWEDGYNANYGWEVLSSMPPGYYPGRFKSITLDSGQAIAIRRARRP